MSVVNKPAIAGNAVVARIRSLAPGVGLSVLITLVSLALQQLEERDRGERNAGTKQAHGQFQHLLGAECNSRAPAMASAACWG